MEQRDWVGRTAHVARGVLGNSRVDVGFEPEMDAGELEGASRMDADEAVVLRKDQSAVQGPECRPSRTACEHERVVTGREIPHAEVVGLGPRLDIRHRSAVRREGRGHARWSPVREREDLPGCQVLHP